MRDELSSWIEAVRDELSSKIGAVREDLSSAVSRIAAEQLRMREEMATKADVQGLVEEFRKMYRIALEASERARSAFEKMLAHGDILQSHEARLTRLEKKTA